MVPKFTSPMVLDELLHKTFDAITSDQWADIIQNGLTKYWKSVRAGAPEHDYSGFGKVGIFIASEDDIPGISLAHLHYSMRPQAQKAFAEGFCKVIDRIPPPPDEDTIRTIEDYRLMAQWMRAKEIIPHVTKRVEENPGAWRGDKDSYHAILQLAQNFNVSASEDSKKLMEAITGPEAARSPHFNPLHTRGFDAGQGAAR